MSLNSAAAIRGRSYRGDMFTELQTDRLVIRRPMMSDLDALVLRRNDAKTARFQSWPVPYPREQAEKLLAGVSAMDGPTDDQWWMATVVEASTGAIVGDLAVNVTWGGRQSEIGYTLAPEHRGRGYASEAANAMVRHLFTVFGTKRIKATMHPDNVASMLVAERSGMTFEGRTKLSFWLGDGADADNSDDLLYGMTRADWDRWQHRPTGPPDEVRLIEITSDNQREVAALETHKSQERLVATVADSYGDALFPPEAPGGGRLQPWLRAIEADGEPVGFLLLSAACEANPEPYIVRLLVDRFHQRRGIGGAALELLESQLRAEGNASVRISWERGRGSPEPFYLARGYEPTGKTIGEEIEGRKRL